MRKSKTQLLDEFTKLLFERDPKGLYAEDNPGKENEYDAEALSILARFVESHLVGMPREDASHVAYAIVQNAFSFWFNGSLPDEQAQALVRALLDAFEAAYAEQIGGPEVVSEP